MTNASAATASATDTRRDRLTASWGFFVSLLLMLYLLRGLVLVCVIPPLEMVDENQHVAYIDFVARHGATPIYSRSAIDPALQRIMATYPGFGEVSYHDYWNVKGAADAAAAKAANRRLYEAQHPPSYYWLMCPIYKALGGAKQIPRVVCVLRLTNVGFSAIGLGAVLWWLGRVCRDRSQAMLLGFCVSLHPLFLLNADRVANDALAIMLGSFAIVWTMCLGKRFLPLQSLGIGGLIGIAVMVKATSLMLLPFAVFCLLLLVVQKRISKRTFILSCWLMMLGTAVLTEQYFRENLKLFGNITPMQEAVTNHVNHAKLSEFFAYAPFTWARIKAWGNAINWWMFNGALWCCNKVIATKRLVQLYELLLLTGAAARIGFKLFRRRFANVPDVLSDKLVGTRILALGLAIFAGMCYHAIHSMVAWHGRVLTCPWYAEVGVPWFLIVLLSGPLALSRTRLGRVALIPVLIVPGLFAWTEIHCTAQKLIPYFAAEPLSLHALKRMASLKPAWLGLPTEFVSFAIVLVLFVWIYGVVLRSMLPHPPPPAVMIRTLVPGPATKWALPPSDRSLPSG